MSRRGLLSSFALMLLGFLLRDDAGAQVPASSDNEQRQPMSQQSGHNRESGEASGKQPSGARMREGTRLAEMVGTIVQNGNRYQFLDEKQGQPLTLLENLALERVLRIQQAYFGTIRWQISGTVTEFRGQNYLLLERAMLRRVEKASPSAAPSDRQ